MEWSKRTKTCQKKRIFHSKLFYTISKKITVEFERRTIRLFVVHYRFSKTSSIYICAPVERVTQILRIYNIYIHYYCTLTAHRRDQHTLGSRYIYICYSRMCMCVCVCRVEMNSENDMCHTSVYKGGRLVRKGSEEFPVPVSGLLLVKTNDSRTRQTRSRIYIYVSILTPRLWLPRRQMTDITLNIYTYKEWVGDVTGWGERDDD